MREKLEETAVFLRPLNYFWFKEMRRLAAGDGTEAWRAEIAQAVWGRNSLAGLFISPPKEREHFALLLNELKEAFERLK
ncbi:MAG: hypothetical protein FGM27_00360 [Candidatus Omnitrophica bacterium]|nr:hypothetical protein [Candidatus Omnitrophota bacterium]